MKTKIVASVFSTLLFFAAPATLRAVETNTPALVIYTIASLPVMVSSNYV